MVKPSEVLHAPPPENQKELIAELLRKLEEVREREKLANESKAELLEIQSSKIELEGQINQIKLAQNKGELLEVSSVQKEWSCAIAQLKAKLLNLPLTLPRDLIALLPEGEIGLAELESIIEEEVSETLSQLAFDETSE